MVLAVGVHELEHFLDLLGAASGLGEFKDVSASVLLVGSKFMKTRWPRSSGVQNPPGLLHSPVKVVAADKAPLVAGEQLPRGARDEEKVVRRLADHVHLDVELVLVLQRGVPQSHKPAVPAGIHFQKPLVPHTLDGHAVPVRPAQHDAAQNSLAAAGPAASKVHTVEIFQVRVRVGAQQHGHVDRQVVHFV